MNDKFKGHTPAPWHAVLRGIGWRVRDANGDPINSGFLDTFSRADAELCAAAPEMLAENERLNQVEKDLINVIETLRFANARLAKTEERTAAENEKLKADLARVCAAFDLTLARRS